MRMRTKLLLCLLSISLGLAGLSLAAVHRVLERQIHDRLQSDLNRSIATYKSMESYRLHMLSRETSLLADLPSLKALMTTDDQRTIRDEGEDFYRVAGTDMLAIADAKGKFVVCNVHPPGAAGPVQANCPDVLTSSEASYGILDSRLYAIAVKPIYFGAPETGSLLGYVAAGYELNHALAFDIGQTAAADVVFSVGGTIVATTLDGRRTQMYAAWSTGQLAQQDRGRDVWLGREHYLAASLPLSGSANEVVRLVVLKSYDEAGAYLRQLDRLLVAIFAAVLAIGCVLAVYLSGSITRPLEQLVAGTQALGSGDFHYQILNTDTKEIRQLSTAFDEMRGRLHNAQQELIQSERLATIGSMARSISHDLRHYLAAVYANAEFLGYAEPRAEVRADLLAEVKAGVQGMTDLIDSLLVFSRTGNALQIGEESIPLVLERAVGMVRNHPDAQGVAITIEAAEPLEAWIDGRKIERAIYNLVLNACQAARHGESPWVKVSLVQDVEWIKILVADNGPGVAESIRVTLFEPFVSEGKQSGVGIGLTLAYHISQEHGGSVTLETSRRGCTIFSLTLAKSRLARFLEVATGADARRLHD